MFDFEEELKKLPGKPGVYLMHDKTDNIIYVGKAVSLKNRVRQYFQAGRNVSPKIERMISQIASFEYIIPDIYVEEDDCEDLEDAPVETSNIEGFKYEVQMQNYSVLPIGMVDRGQEENFKILQWYLNYIEETGLVQFTGNLRSCSVFYYTDVNGNDLVQIRTGLITDGRVEATTGLSFRDFPYREKSKNKNFLRVVK